MTCGLIELRVKMYRKDQNFECFFNPETKCFTLMDKLVLLECYIHYCIFEIISIFFFKFRKIICYVIMY